MTVLTPSIADLDGREALQARIRAGRARLDAGYLPPPSLPTAHQVLALLGDGFEILTAHRHRSDLTQMRDFEVFVIRATSPREAFAALLVVGDTRDVAEPTAPAEGQTYLPSLQGALRTAATASTLVDLFDKLQRRPSVWPTVDGAVTANNDLCFPRLALCRNILKLHGSEGDAVRMLVGLDAFNSVNRFKERESIRAQVAWHLAYESVLCRASQVRQRVQTWLAGLHGDTSDPTRQAWSCDGGVNAAAAALSRRVGMLTDPPVGPDGLIETNHVLDQVDAWMCEASENAPGTLSSSPADATISGGPDHPSG